MNSEMESAGYCREGVKSEMDIDQVSFGTIEKWTGFAYEK